MPTMRQPGYTRLPPDGGEGGQRSDEIAELQRTIRALEQEVATPERERPGAPKGAGEPGSAQPPMKLEHAPLSAAADADDRRCVACAGGHRKHTCSLEERAESKAQSKVVPA